MGPGAKLKTHVFAFNSIIQKPYLISSYRDGGFSAFLKKLRLNQAIPITTFHQMVKNRTISITTSHQTANHHAARQSVDGKLYVFPIESAFKYSHQLNRNESSNGFHILRSHFKFTYSVAFSENYGSVTFSENRKSMM